MSQFLGLSVTLQTDDLQKTEDFYTKYLNFEVISKDSEFLFLIKDLVQLVFHINEDKESESYMSGVLGITCTNIDIVYEKLKDYKGMLSEELEINEFGIRELYLEDNNQYIINIREYQLDEENDDNED
ncbi:MAG: VOC family protein [Candidatus Kapaibacteriota bacterium]|jgi:catechol 2,3-dioxygenase-like lactoylglutathione lyase family enzyme